MTIDLSKGYTSKRADEYAQELRSEIVAELGQEVDFDQDTWLGTITAVFSRALAGTDARLQMIYDSSDPNTATGIALSKLSRIVGVERKPATFSRYTVRAISQNVPRTYQAGSIIEGGGLDDRQRWRLIEDVEIQTTETTLIVEAAESGAVTLDAINPTSFRLVTPIERVTVSYDPTDGDSFSVGQDRETDPELRVRRRQGPQARGGSYAGLRSAIRSIPWVERVSIIRTQPGEILISVYPEPIGQDRITQFAQTVFDATAYGIRWAGAESETVQKPDGTEDVIRWENANTQDVAVVVSGLVPALGVTLEDAEAAVELAILGRFEEVSRGEPVRYLRIIGALDAVSDVIGGSVTLDGGTSDIFPPDETTLLKLPDLGVVFA